MGQGLPSSLVGGKPSLEKLGISDLHGALGRASHMGPLSGVRSRAGLKYPEPTANH